MKWRRMARAHSVRRRIGFSSRPRLEPLEGRQLLATFTVDSVLDIVAADGLTTLREAIEQANATPLAPGESQHLIQFAITSPPGLVKTISIQGTPLPALTRPTFIDGYTQAGASPNSLAVGSNAVLAILLDGTLAGADAHGLTFSTSNGGVQGLAITNFSGSGVVIRGAGSTGNLVAGNWIGLDPITLVAGPNGRNGILIEQNSSANTVGGTTPASRNVVSGNIDDGIELSAGASNNLVSGNYIGTDPAGALPRPNQANGIRIDSAFGNTISGGNLISGNDLDGILLRAGASGNVVTGNLIGTNASGNGALGNGDDGINIASASNNTIGPGNVLAANGSNGLVISGAGATGNLAVGNRIGTNAAGTASLGNLRDGVIIATGATSNTIGGANASPGVLSAGNLIAGNARVGVRLNSVSGNVLRGNFVGTNLAGSAALPNGGQGVFLSGASATTIGGINASPSSLTQGNLISGNTLEGVLVLGAGATGNLLVGNFVGTNALGNSPIGNGLSGVSLAGGTGNTVGGSTIEQRNVVSGNFAFGVEITGASGNLVRGNFIGTNSTGSAPVGNLRHGVHLTVASANTIGGANTTAGVLSVGNLISGNQENGVHLLGASTAENLLVGNFVGTNQAGSSALGNGIDGIQLDGATGNTVGGAAPGDRNLLSGNASDGLELKTGAGGNLVQGNLAGTDAFGSAPLPNQANGIRISNSSLNSVHGNVLSGNALDGLLINFGSPGNVVTGNLIGTNASGNGALGNGDDGINIASASNNTIGPGNVLAANGSNGLVISGAGATGNLAVGNRIGTNAAGTASLGNLRDGVIIATGATSNTIGGPNPADGNLISANGAHGIRITGSGSNNQTILGNHIGTDATGTVALGNALAGIFISSASNTIGPGNLISGNVLRGIDLSGPSATGNLVQGNLIGTNATGDSRLGNLGDGVLVRDGASAATIGGLAPGQGNVISSNSGNGVALLGASGVLVGGNRVGTNAAGTNPLGNMGSGVLLSNSPSNTLSGNVLSANRGFGVALVGGASGNLVSGNRVGTDPAGGLDLGNALHGAMLLGVAGNSLIGNQFAFNRLGGLELRGGSSANAVLGNLIGTDAAGNRPAGNHGPGIVLDGAGGNSISDNTVSANRASGIHVLGGSSGNLLSGNLVGTDQTGAIALGNAGNGVHFENASGNTLSGGVVSANLANGIGLSAGASNNLIIDARVGTDSMGNRPLGNVLSGVFILHAPRNAVRGLLVSANAVTSGGANIRIEGSGATGNLLAGNTIGTNAAGTASLDPDVGTIRLDPGSRPPSGVFVINDRVAQDLRSDGIVIALGASANTIGGSTPADRNLISGNRIGVFIRGSSPSNLISGNFIGTTLTGNAFSESQKQQQGVVILNSSSNTIGGTTEGARNLISGHLESGVRITRQDIDENGDGLIDEPRADTRLNLVAGNHIGTNPAGTAAVGNWQGVFIYGAADNLIGLGSYEQTAGGNVISGNPNGGVQILNAATANARTLNGQIVVNPFQEGNVTSGNIVQGNRIGTSADGLARVANGGTGIFINDAPANTIRQNLVSGNGLTGITLFAPEATGNTLQGNRVGTNIQGQISLELANGWIFASDRPGARRGPGVFLNQVISGSNTLTGNDLRGNVGGERVEWAIRRGPSVQSVIPVVNSATGLVDSLEIVFNGYLDRSSSRTLNPSNYRIALRPSGAAVPLAAVSYDEIGRRITIRLAQGLSLGTRYQITIVGVQPAGLRSRAGLGVNTPSIPLDGLYTGLPGTNAMYEFIGVTPAPLTFSPLVRGRRR